MYRNFAKCSGYPVKHHLQALYKIPEWNEFCNKKNMPKCKPCVLLFYTAILKHFHNDLDLLFNSTFLAHTIFLYNELHDDFLNAANDETLSFRFCFALKNVCLLFGLNVSVICFQVTHDKLKKKLRKCKTCV